MHNLFAWTAIRVYPPPYISINVENGEYTITMRGLDSTKTVQIPVTRVMLLDMADQLKAKLA